MGQRKSTPVNRERILNVAAKLIRERGIANTTLADISVAAEISKGTLYYYYATKGDLIFDVAERHMDRMTRKIFAWLESSGKEHSPQTVYRMVLDTVMRSRSRGQIHVYLIQEALAENPPLRERFVQEYQRWHQIIEEGLSRVYGGDGEYEVMAQVLMATIDGLILQRLIGAKKASTEQIAGFFARASGTPA